MTCRSRSPPHRENTRGAFVPRSNFAPRQDPTRGWEISAAVWSFSLVWLGGRCRQGMADGRRRTDLRPRRCAVPIPLGDIELRLALVGPCNPPVHFRARHRLDVPRLVLDGVRNLLAPTILRDRPVMSVLTRFQKALLAHPWAHHLV